MIISLMIIRAQSCLPSRMLRNPSIYKSAMRRKIFILQGQLLVLFQHLYKRKFMNSEVHKQYSIRIFLY